MTGMDEDDPVEEQPLRSSWARWREAALGATGTPQSTDEVPYEEAPSDLDLQLDWPEGPVPRDAAAEAAASAVSPTPVAVAPAPAPVAGGPAEPEPVAASARSSYEPVWSEPAEEPAPRAAAVPLLPAMASRLDTLHGGLAALAMRFDALAAATNAFRATTGDRIEECLDAIVRTGRAQTKGLADQTRATDRALAELRRSVDDAGDAVQSLGSGTGGADLNDDVLGAVSDDLGTIRDLVAAVLDGMPASAEGSGTDVGGIVSVIDQKVDALATDIDTALASLRDELVHLRRRVGMRGRGGAEDESGPALSEDDVDRIAARLATHLAAQAPPPAPAPARAAAPVPIDDDDEPKPARRTRRATAKATESAEAAAPRRRAPRRSGA